MKDLEKSTYFGEISGGEYTKVQEVYFIVRECIDMVAHDKDAIIKLIEWQKDIKWKIQDNPPARDTRSRTEIMEAAIGVSKPAEISIRNPENICNKGSGTGKRRKSKRELAMINADKDGRTCTFYNKKISPNEMHNRRNCPKRKDAAKMKSVAHI
ncbi:hypothetical protein L2E82_45129 [Cichorium intybus]|uniref:Uncharacterized protein n=1 Tax=Cichorium intybus TaxID=13427 RepID=A0ACB8ZR89_CICIN|nr:hypothetical protein L2E82_45129 [Cichorium intybus]